MRKAKVVVRHFPHEVSDLDPVLTLLEAEGDDGTDNWETRYVLLLWDESYKIRSSEKTDSQ